MYIYTNNFLLKLKCLRIIFWIVLGITYFAHLTNVSNFYYFPLLNLITLLLVGISYYDKPFYVLSFFGIMSAINRGIHLEKIYDIPVIKVIVLIFAYIVVYNFIIYLSSSIIKLVFKLEEENINITIALTNALNSRDKYTKNHSENVATYGVIIAKEMKLPAELCRAIYIGGLLHDIGKIGVPEAMLLKLGRLEPYEFDQIKKHPMIGYNMIKHIDLFDNKGVLDIVLYHHERIDGKGYPLGISGEDIPLTARIISVADSFDAMNSKRNYRDKMDINIIYNELEKNKGVQFDEKIVDVFLNKLKQYRSPEELLAKNKMNKL